MCMTSKYDGKGGRFITEVDYVILDTIWYNQVSTSHCVGEKDTAECWKGSLDELLKLADVS